MKYIKIGLVLLVCCFLTTGCYDKKTEVVEEEKEVVAERMSYKDLKSIIDNYSDHMNTDVIDARDEYLYEEGHIAGSINIPYNDIEDINIDYDREIIIYSDTSVKSKSVANTLIKMGYKDVKYIVGINNWPYELED